MNPLLQVYRSLERLLSLPILNSSKSNLSIKAKKVHGSELSYGHHQQLITKPDFSLSPIRFGWEPHVLTKSLGQSYGIHSSAVHCHITAKDWYTDPFPLWLIPYHLEQLSWPLFPVIIHFLGVFIQSFFDPRACRPLLAPLLSEQHTWLCQFFLWILSILE